MRTFMILAAMVALAVFSVAFAIGSGAPPGERAEAGPTSSVGDPVLCAGGERLYSRSFYSVLEVPDSWRVQTQSGFRLLTPGTDGPFEILLLGGDGELEGVSVLKGESLLEASEFLLAGRGKFDLETIGGSCRVSLGPVEQIYAHGDWRYAKTSGCAGAFAWDATAQCFRSKCSGEGTCKIAVTSSSGTYHHSGDCRDGGFIRLCQGALIVPFG